MANVLLVGKGDPEHGGIPSFIDMVMCDRLRSEHRVDFLNLTRATPPHGGRATLANLLRTVKDTVAVWRSSRGRDVVHLHTALAPGVTAMRAGLLCVAARVRGARVLLHVHGGRVPLWARGQVHRIILAAAMTPTALVVSVSEAVAETLRDAPGHRQVMVLPNGVNVETFVPPSARSGEVTRVLYVGLLTPRKGIVDLLQASRSLHQERVVHELILVGGTPDEGEQAEREVREHLGDDVHLGGTVTHAKMPDVFREADVFCLPSWYEAMPLSVLEAMACGLPVVATDVGDVGRLVIDGETGLVVPRQDPARLAEALGVLLRDAELRATMGAAGRARAVAEFSADVLISRLSDLYTELGARRP